MKPFHTIAIPHQDILSGNLTMDVFAADLWETVNHRGPEEYVDSQLFFQKTYITKGLQNLIDVVEKRLLGNGGDPIIQMKTPFGGGKTHSLIALYHKAKQWGIKTVAIEGTALSADTTLWGLIEKTLTGKIDLMKGMTSPGKELIRKLLEPQQPLLILIDELLQYVTKAAGTKVESNTLANQTYAFIQELTEVVCSLEKVSMIITLPSSILEQYDEAAEKMLQQMEKALGRVEKIFSPVAEDEISRIIRCRLFQHIDGEEAKKVVNEYVQYADKEELITSNISEYREKFIASYPFQPELIDNLYQRWGTFHTFQRTRGVLRLLSTVVFSVKDKTIPYISIADFDLKNKEIRDELIKHIDSQYDSVLNADISDSDSNCSKTNSGLSTTIQGLNLPQKIASTIFMYSFSGGEERGATLNEIKKVVSTNTFPSAVVSDVLEQLKSKLFYLQSSDNRYFFSIKPNINRILLSKLDEIEDNMVQEVEKELLKTIMVNNNLRTYIWEDNPDNIIDTRDLALVVMKENNKATINNIISNKGTTPRVYKNSLIFLCPKETERYTLNADIKKCIGYKELLIDENLILIEQEKKKLEAEIKNFEKKQKDSVRRCYQLIVIPGRNNELKEKTIGNPTFGEGKTISQEIIKVLKDSEDIIEKLSSNVIKIKYLTSNDYVSTKNILESFYRVPGEPKPLAKETLILGIQEGVQNGNFGLGTLENDKPVLQAYKHVSNITLDEFEIIISDKLSLSLLSDQENKNNVVYEDPNIEPEESDNKTETNKGKMVSESLSKDGKQEIQLSFNIPKGKVSEISATINYLQTKFSSIKIILEATEGEISKQDFEDKVLEAFYQLGIKVDE
ncbi:MAG TPA: AAA family ATPase [Caldisericia bacterium]|nr:AAA family ATPase [Caldisericia bacterium]